jgi:hypothetical protein
MVAVYRTCIRPQREFKRIFEDGDVEGTLNRLRESLEGNLREASDYDLILKKRAKNPQGLREVEKDMRYGCWETVWRSARMFLEALTLANRGGFDRVCTYLNLFRSKGKGVLRVPLFGIDD